MNLSASSPSPTPGHSPPVMTQDTLAERIARLERQRARQPDPNSMTILVFSGDLDRLMAAFTVASGAAASGMQVQMFFKCPCANSTSPGCGARPSSAN